MTWDGECICDWPAGCGGFGFVACQGCGGDQCVCVCGGEDECHGCDDCEHDEDDCEHDEDGWDANGSPVEDEA